MTTEFTTQQDNVTATIDLDQACPGGLSSEPVESVSVTVTPMMILDSTDRLFEKARERNIAKMLILGYDVNGNIYVDNNIAAGGDVLWLLECVRKRLMDGVQFVNDQQPQ